MKATFESEDPKEIIQLAKASDMACFIWELTHNAWREFKHTGYDYHPAWDKIRELLEEHNLNPEELL